MRAEKDKSASEILAEQLELYFTRLGKIREGAVLIVIFYKETVVYYDDNNNCY